MKRVLVGLLILCSFSLSLADTLSLRDNAPSQYVVQPGDSLWGIANKFLSKPWEWKKIWHGNSQIHNPNKIYPGDVIVLNRNKGKYSLSLAKGGTIKLSPRVRSRRIDNAVPTIPLTVIKPFLSQSQIFDTDELFLAPYVVDYAGEHIIGSPGTKIYARGIEHAVKNQNYTIYRQGMPYYDPSSRELLGYEATFVGQSRLIEPDDPAVLVITKADQEVLRRDRLLPTEKFFDHITFMPQAPAQHIFGQIVGVLGGVNQIGQYNVVVLNRGKREGMQVGDVLAIFHKGRLVKDPESKYENENVLLPNERVGELMIYKTFSRTSLAIVMHATSAINVLDQVSNP